MQFKNKLLMSFTIAWLNTVTLGTKTIQNVLLHEKHDQNLLR